VGAGPRIQEVSADIVKHFEARLATIEGKAMIVAMSRQICVDLFDAIVALRPAWKGTLVAGKDDSSGVSTVTLRADDFATFIHLAQTKIGLLPPPELSDEQTAQLLTLLHASSP
jgi:hypothetical protein